MRILAKVLLLFIFMNANHLQAKIAAPQEVEPLIYNDMKFTASHSQRGYVKVWNNNTNEKLWDIQVYKENIDPLLESDVQWVFITKLEIKNNKLLVTDDNGEKYLVDIKKRTLESTTTIAPTTFTVWYIFVGIFVIVLSLFVYFIIKNYIT